MNGFLKKIWGNATAFLERTRKIGWADFLVIIALGGILFAVMDLAHRWSGESRPAVEISLAPISLVQYTFFSLFRGLFAYCISLLFTLAYGYWAAKDKLAALILIPLLDILQSIPVLGFMPGLVLALAAVFPRSNIGLELAAVFMIFTGQAWNMTFSFYQSLRSVPQDLKEVATVYHFNGWDRLKCAEIPFATVGLVWNSMMSMAGGWFFLMISESFTLGDKDFRLPGIGSYMSAAVSKGNVCAMLWAVFAMILMIVTLDQFLWRPVVVWAQKFRAEEDGYQEAMSSRVLHLLQRSRILRKIKKIFKRRASSQIKAAGSKSFFSRRIHIPLFFSKSFSTVLFILLLGILSVGALKLAHLILDVLPSEWLRIASSAVLTLSRVLTATALGTLWAVPAGLAIGLSPRLSRIFQPLVQVAAAFPAPMLFPVLIALLSVLGVPLNWGSILLMLLGTQWYILFNVIAGSMAIPADLKEAARSYKIQGWERFIRIYLPAIFPYLVTGWVTAAGGAWNASIVSEYVTFKGRVLAAWGLGAYISQAAEKANFSNLAAGVIVMSTVVVLFNRTVWHSCYQLAERRFSLNK